MQIARYLRQPIDIWLKARMVLMGGPRQVGKTHLAKTFIKSPQAYLSWDDLQDRENIRHHSLPMQHKVLVLDEVHKYPRWRTLIKGLFDKHHDTTRFIVTGSARLDHFRKGGDSLFGRYHYFRLHPFSVPEIDGQMKLASLEDLLEYGGFPEPFLRQSATFSKIWRRERVARVIQQDLRDLTSLKDYLQLELLADTLPMRVGSLLSLNALAEDLEKSPHTIARWIEILSSVYHCFTVAPFGPSKIKAVKKQNKLYLWDWSAVPEKGPRFENLVASHLLKYCHFIEDTEGENMELRFLRDQSGREIDFVVLKNRKPHFAVECKTGEKAVSRHLEYFRDRTKIPAFYQVHQGKRAYESGGIRVLPFSDFCRQVGLV